MVLLHETVHLVGHVHVLNRRRDVVLLFVAHLPDDVTQVLAGTGLGQTGNHMADLETCHRANMLTDQFHTLLRHCLRAVGVHVLCLDGDECHWDLSLDLIMSTNDDGFSDLVVLHEDFLHLSS